VFSKRTYSSLSSQFNLSLPTIKKYIDNFKPNKLKTNNNKQDKQKIVAVIDTVYIKGRNLKIMLAKDCYTGKTLERLYLKSETIISFITLIEKIKQRCKILAIVVDGRKGILKAYPQIPTQMRQFHQIQIINRYLTTKPKLDASRELRKITLTLPTIKKELFIKLLEKWYQKWKILLKEKTLILFTDK